jgi:hypothetical protein
MPEIIKYMSFFNKVRPMNPSPSFIKGGMGGFGVRKILGVYEQDKGSRRKLVDFFNKPT